ncbi:Sensory Transduction Protein Kinase [Liberibacter crescens BT-1]|uniref:histidine kinase n=1 Tax=Liberibacter crescens (strain BT-1) TaxID=1215343 RepID=L0ETG5_LIBCB|nr:PAS domain-containing sensor histidine kinase [Liberibacter crescens]AGA64115.1 Sensory Transduction Protein Kinase [Liberibacter crescens BT-1]AMC12395.1 histidine kinase [Liberibacter crescens]
MSKKTRQLDIIRPFIKYEHHPGTSLRIIVLGLILIFFTTAFVIFKDSLGNGIVLGVLGIFAMIGVFFLILSVIGLIEIIPQSHIDSLATAFINSQPEGILITDERGQVIYANTAYKRLTDSLWNKKIKSLQTLLFSNPEASEVLYRLINNLREGKEGGEELRLMKPLGGNIQSSGSHWYRLKARILPFSFYKNKLLYVWQLTDITTEREDQELFFKELQNAINYLDHAPVGFISASHKDEIVYINATLAEWLGIDLAQFKPGSLTIGDIAAGEGLSLIQSVQAEPGSQKTVTLDLDFRRIDGHVFPVRIVHRVASKFDDAPGESRTIVIARQNCDEADSDGAIATMRFNRFFNNTPMAIASIDSNGHILRTNGSFLKLFSGIIIADNTNIQSIFSIIHDNEKQKMITALKKAKEKKSDIAPVDSLHPKDENRHFRFYVNAVLDQNTEAREEEAIIYAVEITEQKALETRMAQTQKLNAVGTLAGGMAHDFNNVLTAILLSADHLLLQARSSDASFSDLMEIKHNANRAAVLVRKLLAFSRKQTMRPTVLNLTEVITNLRIMIEKLISGPPHVKLYIDYERDLWDVKTDLFQFEQVLVNLCVNAYHAMPKGGILTLRTRNVDAKKIGSFNCSDLPKEDMVLIEVEDTGTGIPSDILDKIFEPFFTTKEVGKGTGLGLSMVYGVVHQSGGYIFPISEVGQGTIFRIFLPRYYEQESLMSLVSNQNQKTISNELSSNVNLQDEPTDLTGKSAIVLLVEDESAVRRGGKRMLEARGYTVHEACSGIEALEVMDKLQGHVDVVVSDVVMPEMDGPTLLRELRKKYPNLKFIFVSGYAEDAFARNLTTDAKFSFLSKPFSLKQLATAVNDALLSDINISS